MQQLSPRNTRKQTCAPVVSAKVNLWGKRHGDSYSGSLALTVRCPACVLPACHKGVDCSITTILLIAPGSHMLQHHALTLMSGCKQCCYSEVPVRSVQRYWCQPTPRCASGVPMLCVQGPFVESTKYTHTYTSHHRYLCFSARVPLFQRPRKLSSCVNLSPPCEVTHEANFGTA